MLAETIDSSHKKHSALGTVDAIIQKLGRFEGNVTAFTTNNILVGINASHVSAYPHTTNFLYLRFPINIQNKRYEFVEGGPVNPLIFRQLRNGLDTLHQPKSDTGHITFDFDRKKGTLRALFNFTFIDSNTGEELIFTGEIKAEGMKLQQR
ncbi:hypothetical protein [Pseudomonas sp. B21-053]|uniref:hypothetical protein n=1 Tax=Pseudomonas sp. B21-053 TaxID=2895493 RepID=UPI00222F6A7A|nr:hypothetical protein [Pseudomonas sp. B21-053]UZE12990.1 hypothetical protein LOY68_05115 [Pseudomonas sp. B21-053]